MQRLEWHCHTKRVSGALYKAILYHVQSAGKEMANSAVFNFQRNAGSDWISLTEVGRVFQARDAAAGNARSPMVARRVSGTTSVDVEADQRRRRPCTSAVNWSVSERYVCPGNFLPGVVFFYNFIGYRNDKDAKDAKTVFRRQKLYVKLGRQKRRFQQNWFLILSSWVTQATNCIYLARMMSFGVFYVTPVIWAIMSRKHNKNDINQ